MVGGFGWESLVERKPVLSYAPRRSVKSIAAFCVCAVLMLAFIAGGVGYGVHLMGEQTRKAKVQRETQEKRAQLVSYKQRLAVLLKKKSPSVDEMAETEELVRRIGSLKADGVTDK